MDQQPTVILKANKVNDTTYAVTIPESMAGVVPSSVVAVVSNTDIAAAAVSLLWQRGSTVLGVMPGHSVQAGETHAICWGIGAAANDISGLALLDGTVYQGSHSRGLPTWAPEPGDKIGITSDGATIAAGLRVIY